VARDGDPPGRRRNLPRVAMRERPAEAGTGSEHGDGAGHQELPRSAVHLLQCRMAGIPMFTMGSSSSECHRDRTTPIAARVVAAAGRPHRGARDCAPARTGPRPAWQTARTHSPTASTGPTVVTSRAGPQRTGTTGRGPHCPSSAPPSAAVGRSGTGLAVSSKLSRQCARFAAIAARRGSSSSQLSMSRTWSSATRRRTSQSPASSAPTSVRARLTDCPSIGSANPSTPRRVIRLGEPPSYGHPWPQAMPRTGIGCRNGTATTRTCDVHASSCHTTLAVAPAPPHRPPARRSRGPVHPRAVGTGTR
jgi:hypothetical protein